MSPDSPEPANTVQINKDFEDVNAVLAAEHAWLRMKRENEELRRRNEVAAETMQYLQEKLQEMEAQLHELHTEMTRTEDLISKERREREALEWEAEQLRTRLARAVDMISQERTHGWWKRLFFK